MTYMFRFFTGRSLVAILALLAVVALGRGVALGSSTGSPGASFVFFPLGAAHPFDLARALQSNAITFGPNMRANQDDSPFGQHEPSLAVSRVYTNALFVAAKDYRETNTKQVWIYGSTDAGVTWPVQLQMPGIPSQVDKQSDPVVVARNDGRIYVAAMAYGGEPFTGGIFITWTDDNGAHWKDPSVPVSYPDKTLDDKEWLAIDNNPCSPYYHRMYMTYNRGAVTVMQHSTDGGETWSAHVPVGVSSYHQFPSPVIGSDGTVYTFMWYYGYNSGPGTIELTKSTDGGVTWSLPSIATSIQSPGSPIRESDNFRFISMPYAAIDPNNGHLYVAWTDNRNFATEGTEVLYVKSTDRGNTWSPEPLRLSHDPKGVVRDHIVPVLSVGRDSRLHALWMDRRLDAANRLFDTWYSSSADGGATWEPDVRVSEVSQDLNVGFPPESGNAAGDYWGLDTYLDTVYVAWNDTRNGNQDIFVSKGLLTMGGAATPTLGCPPPRTETPAPAATPSAKRARRSPACFLTTGRTMAACHSRGTLSLISWVKSPPSTASHIRCSTSSARSSSTTLRTSLRSMCSYRSLAHSAISRSTLTERQARRPIPRQGRCSSRRRASAWEASSWTTGSSTERWPSKAILSLKNSRSSRTWTGRLTRCSTLSARCSSFTRRISRPTISS
jgi:hypothetical protein